MIERRKPDKDPKELEVERAEDGVEEVAPDKVEDARHPKEVTHEENRHSYPIVSLDFMSMDDRGEMVKKPEDKEEAATTGGPLQSHTRCS